MRKILLSLHLLLLTFFFAGVSQVLASNWQELKAKALELAIAGQDDDAHSAYAQAIKKAKEQFGESAPFIGALYFEMGEMDLAAKKFSWADDSLSQASRLMPNSPSVHLKLAELFQLQDRPGQVREQAAIILQKHRDCLAARQLLAGSYQRQGDAAKAVKEFYNYALSAASGPILQPPPAADTFVESDIAKNKPTSESQQPGDKGPRPDAVKGQTMLLPGSSSALMSAKTQSASASKTGKHKHKNGKKEDALMPEAASSKANAALESHKGKSKRAKAASEGQSSKAASSRAKPRVKASEPVPLKAKATQLKARQKSLPKGLVPPPPPIVPSFGGYLPPLPPPPTDSHPKPKDKAKETAKESAKEPAKESGKASTKEAGGKEAGHNAGPGEGSDFLLDWAGPKKKGN